MSLMSELKLANRYDDIVSILNNLIADNTVSYPLYKPYMATSGDTIWRVDGNLVRKQATLLLQLIDDDCDGNTSDDFSELSAYIRSHSEMLLHNYAVAISHNNIPDVNMDVIRSWEILDNLLLCWNCNCVYSWDIPISWRKIA